jgi:putative ABC transport system permease protein
MRAGLNRDAHQLLGADLLINADQPLRQDWREEAARRGLLLADTVTFPSMAQAGQGDASQAVLASVKAVSPTYPLRGQLKVTTSPADAGEALGDATRETPAPGTVWVDVNLLPALKASVGTSIQLGDKTFKIARLIATEPDRGASFSNFAPRVMLALADLKATGLVDNYARITWRMQVAARSPNDQAAVAGYERWVRERMRLENVKGVRIETLENGRPEMRSTWRRWP